MVWNSREEENLQNNTDASVPPVFHGSLEVVGMSAELSPSSMKLEQSDKKKKSK